MRGPGADAAAHEAPLGPTVHARSNHASDTRVERWGRVRVVVWTDGYVGAEGAGWGFLARRGEGAITDRGPLPPCPSHEAEWTAVLRALAWALGALEAGDELEVRTDSALVAKGLASRRPEMSGVAGEMRAQARRTLAALAERGVRSRVVRVARTENTEADGLAREGAAQR